MNDSKLPQYVDITLRLNNVQVGDTRHITFTFQDCVTNVSEGKKKIGEICGGVGAFEFGWHDKRFTIKHKDVWMALDKALKEAEHASPKLG